MQKISILLIATIFLVTSANAEVEWGEGITQELRLGEKMTSGNYTIEIVNFPAPVEGYKPLMKDEEKPAVPIYPFVVVRLYNKTTLVDEWTLFQGDVQTYNDEIKITVESLPKPDAKEWINKYYNPVAKIKLQTGKNPYAFKEPNIVINFTTGREYKPLSSIQLDVKVKNNGGEDAKDVNLNINVITSLVKTDGILYWQRLNNSDILKKNEEIIVPITYYTPLILDSGNYTLNVTAETSWTDINRTKKFKASNTSNFTVTVLQQWDFTVQKSVKKEVHIGDEAFVSITIQNTGLNDIDLDVIDSIPDGFTLLEGNITWKVKINKSDAWTALYKIKPDRPLSISLPAAKAIYRTNLRNYTKESNSPSLLVYGPYVIVEKSLPSEALVNSNVTVTLKVSNTGDRRAVINLTDSIPEGAYLVSGNLGSRLSLKGGDSNTMEYVVLFKNTGVFTLPPAEASFYEHLYIIYRGVVSSEPGIINITEPKVTALETTTAPVELSAPDESLFSRLSGINVLSIPLTVFIPLVFILFTVLLYTVRQRAIEQRIWKKYFK